MIAVALAAMMTVAQDPPIPPPPVRGQEAVRVFLDCQTHGCDFEYFRTEIRFVNWVRDRNVADVHVLVTSEGAGGGTTYTLAFIGLRRLAGQADTLRYTSSQTDTGNERRDGIAQTLRLGLVRHVAGTPMGRRLRIALDGDAATTGQAPHDPWNYWVFTLSGNANLSGEESSHETEFRGAVRARRTTENWKLRIDLDGQSQRSRFEIDDTTSFVSRRTSWSFETLVVRSLGPHWSAGVLAELQHRSFRNLKVQFSGGPAVEFNVFPYEESTRRSFTFQYAIGVEASRYQDTTIYGLTRETRPVHTIEARLEARQPWGSLFFSSDFWQYLHDTRKLNFGVNGSANVRIVRGLSFNVFGGYQVVRSQLYLPAGGATAEEIIARQRALATGYSYHSGVGLNYTFGSIFNNVVNPRF